MGSKSSFSVVRNERSGKMRIRIMTYLLVFVVLGPIGCYYPYPYVQPLPSYTPEPEVTRKGRQKCLVCSGTGQVKCLNCGGTGHGFVCCVCGGTGIKTLGGFRSKCMSCRGTGFTKCGSCCGTGFHKCYVCGGKGYTSY